ncbi:MAG: hypothetical protein IJ157_14025 [Clostridia bacterium]|nr:hypothetical protein [Clostridia bacterium]
MRTQRRPLIFLGLAVLLACLLCATALGDEARFPAGVIEIPQGTPITIDEDAGTVTLAHPDTVPQPGDAFVVYLQDLPIGYVAKTVEWREGSAVIAVDRADPSIYGMLEESGTVVLSGEMYAFVPAANSAVEIGDALKFEDGSLIVTVSPAAGTELEVSLSNLRLDHAFSSGEVSVSLSGNYDISVGFSVDEDDLSYQFPLGEIRIYGVGKIGLYVDLSCEASLKYALQGYFSVGFTADDTGNHLRKVFSLDGTAIEGKGEIGLGLKLTAGVDVLVAEADLFAEIGVATQVETKSTYHPEWDPPAATFCEEYGFFVFCKVGAEAKYTNALGQTKNLVAADFDLLDEDDSPIRVGMHYENGEPVPGCTVGMEPSILNIDYNGRITDPDDALFIDRGNRALETEVWLPWDVTVNGDYVIADGGLEMNGHTMIVNGDLILENGYLKLQGGTLIVHGNLRMQRRTSGGWGDSDAFLDVSWSDNRILIDGDLILQTNAENNAFYGGVIRIGGSLIQKNAAGNRSNFITYEGMHVVFTAEGSHTIQLESPETVTFHSLTLEGDVEAFSDLHIVDAAIGGHRLTADADLYQTGNVSLGGGSVTVRGNLYHSHGDLVIGGGEMHILGGYYNAGADSVYAQGLQGLTDGSGMLSMEDAAGVMRVDGSFVLRTFYGCRLTAGTLYLGGDFRQVIPDYWIFDYFTAEASHKTVLNGSGSQRISFESADNGFGTLEAVNQNLIFEKNVNWLVQGSDIRGAFDGVLGLRDVDLNGKRLTVDGDLHVRSNLDLRGGVLSVSGDLYHHMGEINVNGGRIEIAGNYYNVDEDSAQAGGEDFTAGAGALRMNSAADEVRVGGSFVTYSQFGNMDLLTAGTLYVAGDFIQRMEHGFDAQGGHKTVLNGTGPQTVSFEIEGCHFGILKLTQPRDNYSFTPDPCWIKLIEAEEPVFSVPDLVLPSALETIEESAFERIGALVVLVPDTCGGIGAYAFRDSAVTQIRIPAGCAVGEGAFDGCGQVTVFGTAGSPAESYCAAHDNCVFIAE